jgi:lipid-A-disaccharide synthase
MLTVIEGETFDALNAADAAAVTSGTATLEAGIIGTPMVIVYKTSGFNYKLLRPLIEVEHFGLINLIAGERVATELIQHEFTPTALADELERILEPVVNTDVRSRLAAAVDKLGHGGASERAARAILTLLDRDATSEARP